MTGRTGRGGGGGVLGADSPCVTMTDAAHPPKKKASQEGRLHFVNAIKGADVLD